VGYDRDEYMGYDVDRIKRPIKGTGRHISIKLQNNTLDEEFALIDMEIKGEKYLGRTRSDAVQTKAIGAHIGIMLQNDTLGEDFELNYILAQIERQAAR
jgi:hypothetical protein